MRNTLNAIIIARRRTPARPQAPCWIGPPSLHITTYPTTVSHPETAMKFRRMGRTGLKVSEICLGTMTFGNQCDERTSFAIMDKAAEHGVTFLDTADAYPVPPTPETAGRTEEIVGKWLKG